MPLTLTRDDHNSLVNWTSSTSPFREPEGRIAGVVCTWQEMIAGVRARNGLAAVSHRLLDLFRQAAGGAHKSDKLPASERFARATIDALSEHIAVLDGSGQILAVNAAWREFASSNGITAGTVSEGANYLDVCDRADMSGDDDAAEVAAIIRAVAAGDRDASSWEYPCHAPNEERWFSVKVTRFQDDGPARIVVAHENITERRSNERRIEYLATHDALTGLPNRNLLNDRFQQAIDHSQRTGLGLALFFLDLDNFKYLNDAFGHSIGDQILKSVARELRGMLRPSDTVARLGGDEFVVILTDLQNSGIDAAKVARAILERFSYPLSLQDREATVTPSIGISLSPSDGQTLDELLRTADAAMYRAKQLGRAAFQFYSAEMSAKSNERVILEGELRRALRLGQFHLSYQPQVLNVSGDIIGVEALLRWSHPELGDVPPSRFIPVAEETGLIHEIGQWVLAAACRQNKAWQRSGFGLMPIAVNVSAAQLKNPGFFDMVGDVLSQTGLDPCWLELEITESLMMENDSSTLTRLKELRARGIGLSLDDFGTGYSNLGYLARFPLSRLKIDRSFVRPLPGDANAASIVRAILALGATLDLEVIAEGIENRQQLEFLTSAGCRYSQGFLFGRPIKAIEFEAIHLLGTRQELRPQYAHPAA